MGIETENGNMSRQFTVNVVTGQGGAGHYATYYAIKAVAEQRHLPWRFQVTDMDEIIENLSAENQIQNAYEKFGFSGHDLYNLMVKGGWTWLWPLKMRLNKLLVKMNHAVGVDIFEAYWRSQSPDLVVSVMPLYNKGLYESLQRSQPGTPYVTVLTDFADCPPAFWFDPDANNTLVCGTEKAVLQAQEQGVDESRIVPSSGLVVHPDFYAQRADTCSDDWRNQRRKTLGLRADTPTGIVMFGGNGSDAMLEIAARLESLGDRAQFLFMCGRNDSVAESLRAYEGPQKRAVVGFTDEMADYMSLADFFVGKPGNVSVSEALTMKLPVITECNWATMSQERYCAQWVEEQRVGLVIRSFKGVARAVGQMIEPATFAQMKENLEQIDNRAVFEVVDLLEKIARETLDSKAADNRIGHSSGIERDSGSVARCESVV